jgi:pyridoxine/pyridoxamine 5'-phosphate oxidase
MSPQRSAELAAFINACDLAVVSYLSPEGTPQSAVVGFAVTPALEIVFDTVASSRKYSSLKARPECSLVMWMGEKTVQFEGLAQETTDEFYKEAYFKKLPDGRDRLKWAGIAYFVVRPKWIRYSDFDARPPAIEEFGFQLEDPRTEVAGL